MRLKKYLALWVEKFLEKHKPKKVVEYFTTSTNTDIRQSIFLRVLFPLYFVFAFQILQNDNKYIVTRQLLTLFFNTNKLKLLV